MEASRHVPVMLEETLELLQPAPGRTIADLTLGGAGHTSALLRAGAKVIGFDRDSAALDRASARLVPHTDRFVPVHRDFGSLAEVLDDLGLGRVDGVLMDLGLSSDQLDDPGRGFAFRLEGPLDLRFDTTRGEPAWQRLASADRATITTWLREFGEVRAAGRIATAMVQRAASGELRTTTQLRELVQQRVGRGPRLEGELARVFQSLRILVNSELDQLDRVLSLLPDRLNAGGRFVAIAYHSLEDRRVKTMLRRESGRLPRASRHVPLVEAPEPRLRDLTPKALRPSEVEVAANPRARSARLRAGERL